MTPENFRRFIDWPPEMQGDAYEGPMPSRNGHTKPRVIVPGEDGNSLPIMSCTELLSKYPERRPAVIEGLLRRGETMNLIAAPKVGKSWLSLGLAFSVATGRPWLSTFATAQGNVLLIDNELHPETSAHRLRTLVGALHWPIEDIGEKVHIVNLRGRLHNLNDLGLGLKKIERDRYKLVVIDAFYRVLPIGTDENDNASMAELYNTLDYYADLLGASFGLVHHASKGDQSAKSVTDVGAGAGAQSRATDTHVILRPHEEENVVVLDAAVRSWPPVASLCVRWNFPVWTPASDLDPTALRSSRHRKNQPKRHEEPAKPKDPPWTARRFADELGQPEPLARAAILESAQLRGLSDRKAERLLKAAIECSYLFTWRADGQANRWLVSKTVPPTVPISPAPKSAPARRRNRPKRRG
jgi:hypothetical protein